MKFSDLLNSHISIALGLFLSRLLPTRLGYPLAQWLADRISNRRHMLMVKSVRANQWVIHNRQLNAAQLNQFVRETFRSSARSLYEFWHNFSDPRAVQDMVEFDPSFIECFDRARSEKSGTLLVMAHMCNFDIVGRAFTLRGLEMQILSYPQPPGGYRWQNHLRELPGMTITPMSIQALRQASQTLRANKVVLTGVDRPLPITEEGKYRPRFFGIAAAMPVFHIRLALKHNLPITVLGACRKADGCYRVWASDPIPMQRQPDLVQETVQNAENILAVVADYIRKAPDQWAMYYPIWPETIDQIPV